MWTNVIKKKECNVYAQPTFISCDPIRGILVVLKEYLKSFHSSMVELVGTCCKNKEREAIGTL